nr:immunoglobulin heavy chain junction region [Macaca mulatta]MOW76849.1 immunoglobulin heavy chain junction region [Macaca mulatta]MOW76947.1 immunoglobulin heavy chain junction region [Macaca mulatta]MOW77034.1 immunoglobulin heavy chain junction region [Macaca mulatta]MOW77366.1 immunoglobulin heavy chain junction region [Macaca mulatta]
CARDGGDYEYSSLDVW